MRIHAFIPFKANQPGTATRASFMMRTRNRRHIRPPSFPRCHHAMLINLDNDPDQRSCPSFSGMAEAFWDDPFSDGRKKAPSPVRVRLETPITSPGLEPSGRTRTHTSTISASLREISEEDLTSHSNDQANPADLIPTTRDYPANPARASEHAEYGARRP
jgi:hypothetical protein